MFCITYVDEVVVEVSGFKSAIGVIYFQENARRVVIACGGGSGKIIGVVIVRVLMIIVMVIVR
jgi:hypothetical protein